MRRQTFAGEKNTLSHKKMKPLEPSGERASSAPRDSRFARQEKPQKAPVTLDVRPVLKPLLILLIMILLLIFANVFYYRFMAKIYLNKGAQCARARQWKDAVRNYQQTLYFNRNSAIALSAMGELYLRLGDISKGLIYLNRAKSIDPTNGICYYYLGTVWGYMGNDGELQDMLKEGVEKNVKDRRYLDLLRLEAPLFFPTVENMRLIKKEEDLTVERLRNGGGEFFLTHLGLIDMYKGNYSDAVSTFQGLLSTHRENPDFLTYLGITEYKNRKYDEALASLRRAAEIDPQNALAMQYIGAACLELEKFEEASRELKKALALSPESAGVHYFLGMLHFKKKEYEEARNEFDMSVTCQPNLGDGYQMREEARKKLKMRPVEETIEDTHGHHEIDREILKGPLYILSPGY